MRSHWGFSILAVIGLATFISAGRRQAGGPEQATFERYCLTCHNQNLKERGTVPIAFDKLNLSNVGADAEVWEKIVRKVRTGLMPPSGRPRPDKVAHDAFVNWIQSE